jgi:hypothetical protein
LLTGVVAAAVIVGVALAFVAVTPLRHVAPGCFWWTAAQVGNVVPASRGCVRGYVRIGGWLSEGTGSGDYSLFMRLADPDQPITRPNCPFQPGDPVVVRYHAVNDGGQTIVVIDDCR